MERIVIGYEAGPQGDDAVALGETFAAALGGEADRCTVAGRDVARGLAAEAEERGAALIVIGSCHRGTIGRIALGSVGATLIADAPCAVAVAPVGYSEREQQRLLRIASAYDGGAESRSALEAAVAIAVRTRARLSLLTAVDVAAHGLSAPVPTGAGPAVVANEQQAMQGVLRTGLDRVPDELPVDGQLLIGPAAAELAQAASDADLLVVGSRAHGTLGRTLLGSVSTELIHQATCPVLVIPRGGALPDWEG